MTSVKPSLTGPNPVLTSPHCPFGFGPFPLMPSCFSLRTDLTCLCDLTVARVRHAVRRALRPPPVCLARQTSCTEIGRRRGPPRDHPDNRPPGPGSGRCHHHVHLDLAASRLLTGRRRSAFLSRRSRCTLAAHRTSSKKTPLSHVRLIPDCTLRIHAFLTQQPSSSVSADQLDSCLLLTLR